MRFKTVSGSEYEIVNHPSGSVVRRLNTKYKKRVDGEWVRLLNEPVIEVGGQALLVMPSLSEFGYDDIGTPEELASEYMTRVTSTITEVFE